MPFSNSGCGVWQRVPCAIGTRFEPTLQVCIMQQQQQQVYMQSKLRNSHTMHYFIVDNRQPFVNNNNCQLAVCPCSTNSIGTIGGNCPSSLNCVQVRCLSLSSPNRRLYRVHAVNKHRWSFMFRSQFQYHIRCRRMVSHHHLFAINRAPIIRMN